MRSGLRVWLPIIVLLLGFMLAACVSSGGGGTPVPAGNPVPGTVDDNATTAPLPFPKEIGETMTAQAKSGFVASTPVP